jgi:hypothetical protein
MTAGLLLTTTAARLLALDGLETLNQLFVLLDFFKAFVLKWSNYYLTS